MADLHAMRPLKFRSVWISDVHLGSRACKADFLLDFLHSVHTHHLYLVGDIIDLQAMQRGVFWPQSHNNVIRAILGKAKHDTHVVYIPGNHDELIRSYTGQIFGNVDIRRTAIHELRDGRRLLVMHGDEFDGMIKCPSILSWIGAGSYELLLFINRIFNAARQRVGMPYWSLSSYLKSKSTNAQKHVENFERQLTGYARKRRVDGIVCGHIHLPKLSLSEDTLYSNTGDWVEHCTALVERMDGTLALIHWTDQQYAVCSLEAAA